MVKCIKIRIKGYLKNINDNTNNDVLDRKLIIKFLNKQIERGEFDAD